MSLSHASPSSKSSPYVGTLKIFPLLCDEVKLNFIFFTDQDKGLQHLKVADTTKGSKLKINQWFKLRGFKQQQNNFILDGSSSISPFNAPKPEVTQEMKATAAALLHDFMFSKIDQIKSAAMENWTRCSVVGKIICAGRKENKVKKGNRDPFAMQNYRLADETGTIRIVAFNRKEPILRGQNYVIHNARKKIYEGRHQIEVDDSTVIEEALQFEADELNNDMSANEDDTSNELQGDITGIVCGSTILYDACNKCKKKFQNGCCPKRCSAGSKKAVTAKLDIEYEENGAQDVQVQVFTEHLQMILGKDCDTFENADAYEEDFGFICPVKIKFQIDSDNDGKKKLAECEVIRRWEPEDVVE